jgi:hypothetical protein
MKPVHHVEFVSGPGDSGLVKLDGREIECLRIDVEKNWLSQIGEPARVTLEFFANVNTPETPKENFDRLAQEQLLRKMGAAPIVMHGQWNYPKVDEAVKAERDRIADWLRDHSLFVVSEQIRQGVHLTPISPPSSPEKGEAEPPKPPQFDPRLLSKVGETCPVCWAGQFQLQAAANGQSEPFIACNLMGCGASYDADGNRLSWPRTEPETEPVCPECGQAMELMKGKWKCPDGPHPQASASEKNLSKGA